MMRLQLIALVIALTSLSLAIYNLVELNPKVALLFSVPFAISLLALLWALRSAQRVPQFLSPVLVQKGKERFDGVGPHERLISFPIPYHQPPAVTCKAVPDLLDLLVGERGIENPEVLERTERSFKVRLSLKHNWGSIRWKSAGPTSRKASHT